MDIKEIIEKLGRCLSTHPEIKVGYIFGSRICGRDNKLSDIDIAILIDDEVLKIEYPYGYKAGVLTELMKALKTNEVDLVILNTASCFLRQRIIYYGKVIYSCDELKRIDFQVKTVNEYNDVKRLLSVHH